MREHKLLERTDDFEVYEITWPPGTGLDWHTHGASHAHVVVVEGELTEWVRNPTRMPVEMHARGSQAERLTHVSGSVFTREAYTAHKVVNTSRKPARSVHTYTPPMTITYSDEMEIY